MRNLRRAGAAVLVAVMIGGAGASAASALANPTWWSICASYSGRSWYTNGSGKASTTASDNDIVGAALRYYAGAGPLHKAAHQVTASRAVVPTGGYHQSYCGMTVQMASSL